MGSEDSGGVVGSAAGVSAGVGAGVAVGSIVFSGSGVGEEVETGFIGELSSISEDEVTKTGVGLGETET